MTSSLYLTSAQIDQKFGVKIPGDIYVNDDIKVDMKKINDLVKLASEYEAD